jgi:predicted RNase H-like HicB family nuclease
MLAQREKPGNVHQKEANWESFLNNPKKPYECRVYVLPAEEGGFYAYVPALPGVATQGNTEREVRDNIADAFRGAVMTYQEAQEAIPWASECEERPAEARELRIVVDV